MVFETISEVLVANNGKFLLVELRFNVCVSGHVKAYAGKQFLNGRAGGHASANSFCDCVQNCNELVSF